MDSTTVDPSPAAGIGKAVILRSILHSAHLDRDIFEIFVRPTFLWIRNTEEVKDIFVIEHNDRARMGGNQIGYLIPNRVPLVVIDVGERCIETVFGNQIIYRTKRFAYCIWLPRETLHIQSIWSCA